MSDDPTTPPQPPLPKMLAGLAQKLKEAREDQPAISLEELRAQTPQGDTIPLEQLLAKKPGFHSIRLRSYCAGVSRERVAMGR